MTAHDALVEVHGDLEHWLHYLALPLWSGIGCDRSWGGFFEQMDNSGNVLDGPRRSRLVARQIYVFAEAARMGWSGPGHGMVRHGLDFLLHRQLRSDGLARLHVLPEAEDDTFDLYDQAFVLFAFAAAARIDGRGPEMMRHADRLFRSLAAYRHRVGGFHEGRHCDVPLRSNPHMHLFEAALAMAEIDPGHGVARLADELACLCIEALVAPATGAVHEYFDEDWRVVRELPHGMVEPGHQYEWGWLLLRWANAGKREDAADKAIRMIGLAESHGVSHHGLAINGLDPDLAPLDIRHRLWPQTERIKAHVEMARQAASSMARDRAEGLAAQAARGLIRFLDHPVAGAWWEHLDKDGLPVTEPARASSLYHIMCAFRTMSDYVAERKAKACDARDLV